MLLHHKLSCKGTVGGLDVRDVDTSVRNLVFNFSNYSTCNLILFL